MFRTFQCFLFIALLTFFNSCGNRKGISGTQVTDQDQLKEKLLEANKAVIDVENEQIDKLIATSGWEMIKTATGLRYQFIEKGNGEKSSVEKIARIEYEVKLITNETIYSSLLTGPKEFRIGSGGVESGLEEGILLMRVGDKVRFVIPSYLAHGLSGDQDKIPPKASLIYTVKLIDLK